MGIQEKLDYLEDTKQAIKQAIIDKGIAVGDEDTFRSYANKITDELFAKQFGLTVEDILGTVDVNGTLTIPRDNLVLNFQGVLDVGDNTSINFPRYIQVSFPDLVNISGSHSCSHAFSACTNLTSIDLSNLVTISGYYACYRMLRQCTNIYTVDLSSLTTISGNYSCYQMFYQCTGLNTIDLSSLTTITGSLACYKMFEGCSNLQQLSFPSLTKDSFGNNTNQFSSMLQGVTGCTVHFPASLQGVIGSWADVKNGFGGTDTVVLFDL